MEAAAAPQSDAFAFTDPKMEVAYVAYLARRSQAGSTALCCARWLAGAAVGGRFLHATLQRCLQTGGGGVRNGAQAALLLVLWAAVSVEDAGLLRCLRGQQPAAQPLAAHEARKAHNVLCHAMARMVACISVAALLGPLPAAPVCAACSGTEVVANHLRLAVGLPLLALSCLCCCFTLAGQALGSADWAADVAAGAAGTLALGFLLPAAALAWQELRCRHAFAGLHRIDAWEAMPPVWQAAAKYLRTWSHPAAGTEPASAAAKLQQPAKQPQLPEPALLAACSSCQAAACS